MAAGCELDVAEINDKGVIVKNTIPFDATFFTGYRKNVIAPHQVLISLKVPYTQQDEYFTSFKQARRREDDIAIVNAAFFFKLSPDEKVIQNARAAFGGMAPTTKMALKTTEFLQGKAWSNTTIEEATTILLDEFPLPPSVPGGMVRYRQALTASFLFKAYLRISLESKLGDVSDAEKSAADIYHRAPIKSHQVKSLKLQIEPLFLKLS